MRRVTLIAVSLWVVLCGGCASATLDAPYTRVVSAAQDLYPPVDLSGAPPQPAKEWFRQYPAYEGFADPLWGVTALHIDRPDQHEVQIVNRAKFVTRDTTILLAPVGPNRTRVIVHSVKTEDPLILSTRPRSKRDRSYERARLREIKRAVADER